MFANSCRAFWVSVFQFSVLVSHETVNIGVLFYNNRLLNEDVVLSGTSSPYMQEENNIDNGNDQVSKLCVRATVC